MPKFEIISTNEAQDKALLGGEKGKIVAMYTFFIEQLKDGKAGKLRPSEGETVHAVRRRLGKAARMAGKELTIKRVDNEVYFWLTANKKQKPRRKNGNESKIISFPKAVKETNQESLNVPQPNGSQ